MDLRGARIEILALGTFRYKRDKKTKKYVLIRLFVYYPQIHRLNGKNKTIKETKKGTCFIACPDFFMFKTKAVF